VAELFEEMKEMIIKANREALVRIVRQSLDGGAKAKEIIDRGLIPGMEVVGERMKTGEMFIPEVIHSGKTMQSAIDFLAPYLDKSDVTAKGVVVIGTVEGDMHDIGKNLVSMMLNGAGFKVIDLGVDVKPQFFVEAVTKHKPDVLGMSALLTTTMIKMKETIAAIQEAGLREKVKVIAGGAPVTQKLVDDVGADGYGSNASIAIELVNKLIHQSQKSSNY
jgi:5-methyltetrahydrofolate--homocysteine methyltransferase